MDYPRVCIIILNWNGLEDTIECLESLQKINYPNYKVVVIDNASEGDDTEVLRQKFGGYINIIENDKNYGFAEGNNIGIRQALQKGVDYVLLLNNDTVVDPEFLDELINIVEADPRIGIICPMIFYYDEPDKVWFGGGEKVDLFRGIGTKMRGGESNSLVVESGFASGAAMLISRDTLQKIGLLPDYFFGVEDIDYSIKALRAGFRIVVAVRAKVLHKGSKSAAGISVSRIGHHYMGWQLMRRKYLSTSSYIFATCCALIWGIIRSITPLSRYFLRRDWPSVISFFKKVLEALKGTIKGMIRVLEDR